MRSVRWTAPGPRPLRAYGPRGLRVRTWHGQSHDHDDDDDYDDDDDHFDNDDDTDDDDDDDHDDDDDDDSADTDDTDDTDDTEILRYWDTVEADEVQDADVEDDEVGGWYDVEDDASASLTVSRISS